MTVMTDNTQTLQCPLIFDLLVIIKLQCNISNALVIIIMYTYTLHLLAVLTLLYAVPVQPI